MNDPFDKFCEMILPLVMLAAVVILGTLVIEYLPYGYEEASTLYLAGVIAASAFYLGRKKS